MTTAVETSDHANFLAAATFPLECKRPHSPAPFIRLSADARLLTNSSIQAPFAAIRQLFHHLRVSPDVATALNATYPKRGIFKTAANHNAIPDQKFTIDLSSRRISLIPDDLRASLAPHGFEATLSFLNAAGTAYVSPILAGLNAAGGADFTPYHSRGNLTGAFAITTRQREHHKTLTAAGSTPTTVPSASSQGWGRRPGD